jgi:predicted thioesterase
MDTGPEPQRSREPSRAQQSSTGAAPATAGWLGAMARVELTVTDADTAQSIGSGDVPVLATPRLLALAEAATVAATATKLPPGATTVGTRVELDHRTPTSVGRTVAAEARLSKVDGRRLTFEITAWAGTELVAEGRIERALVDRHRFLERAFEQ